MFVCYTVILFLDVFCILKKSPKLGYIWHIKFTSSSVVEENNSEIYFRNNKMLPVMNSGMSSFPIQVQALYLFANYRILLQV